MGNNLSRHILPKLAISPASRGSGSTNGNVIDRRDMDAALVTIVAGALDSGNATVKLQHGDAANGSDMADFATTSPTSAAASADDTPTVFSVDLQSAKRYIRAVLTLASASTASFVGVMIDLAPTGGHLADSDFDDYDGHFVAE